MPKKTTKYKMQFCETHQRRYRTVCEQCIFDQEDEEMDRLQDEQLRKEIAAMRNLDVEEVTQDDIDLLKERGWSVSLDGGRYCLNCGAGLEGRTSYLYDGNGNWEEIDHGAFEDRKSCLACETKFD